MSIYYFSIRIRIRMPLFSVPTALTQAEHVVYLTVMCYYNIHIGKTLVSTILINEVVSFQIKLNAMESKAQFKKKNMKRNIL